MLGDTFNERSSEISKSISCASTKASIIFKAYTPSFSQPIAMLSPFATNWLNRILPLRSAIVTRAFPCSANENQR